MQLEIALAELREMRGVTQSSVADTLGMSRPNVARIERELDIRLSTLERYVQALGGKLEVHAVFADQDVTLTARPTRPLDVLARIGDPDRAMLGGEPSGVGHRDRRVPGRRDLTGANLENAESTPPH